ncbi:DNA-binding transcriptional MerR regulator [Kineothrix alysoides]|uniref:DNA-binding transcriptional MerR regulator n=1 Tax=Kineothrix alysoides TaxID=1469948 RepID=A0A4V2QCD5_9FIRM|nr:MerR family transcriptional regulator [Kineothrix alysoides]TCL59867.1 DNA-binding transcriptional MerR regulator [Kineothrix alysoides]
MIKIGDFSKLSRISIRMLRHYDEIGLLVPASIDAFTGYRYYSEAQLPLAERIHVLKNMGFGLAVIQEILEKFDDAQEMEKFLQVKRRELEEEENATKQRIILLDNAINWLRKDGNFMDYTVSLKILPERYVASIRQVIPSYGSEGMLWGILGQEGGPQNIQPDNPCYSLAIFHDEGYKEKDVDVEIQFSVVGKYKDTEHVKFKTVAPIQIASATYKGSYEQITRVNEAVAHWVMGNGYDFDGASFCIYHVSPHDAATEDDLVTEVCYPVKKK